MANDKLMTYDQGESIKTTLGTIATNITNINKNIELPSNKVTSMLGYTKGSDTSAIGTSDTLNAAIGKLEKRTDNNTTNILKCSTYSATVTPVSGTATFTEFLRNARDTLGVSGMFTCEISIYTETFGECLLMYVQIQPFVNESHTVIYNNTLALNAINYLGTIVVTGCTADCTAKVRIFA